MRFDEVSNSLIDQAREGSATSMEQLCLTIQPAAFALLLSILRDPDDASDALQESLIRVVRFLPKLRDTTLFSRWFMRILVNQANSTRSRATAHVIDLPGAEPAQAERPITFKTSEAPLDPRRAAAGAEVSNIINEAVRQLPARQKTALVLFEIEHMTIRQVAEVMELTDGAVKFHLHEARKNLRQQLTDLGISPHELTKEESAV